jgi:hypothetical protein
VRSIRPAVAYLSYLPLYLRHREIRRSTDAVRLDIGSNGQDDIRQSDSWHHEEIGRDDKIELVKGLVTVRELKKPKSRHNELYPKHHPETIPKSLNIPALIDKGQVRRYNNNAIFFS